MCRTNRKTNLQIDIYCTHYVQWFTSQFSACRDQKRAEYAIHEESVSRKTCIVITSAYILRSCYLAENKPTEKKTESTTKQYATDYICWTTYKLMTIWYASRSLSKTYPIFKCSNCTVFALFNNVEFIRYIYINVYRGVNFTQNYLNAIPGALTNQTAVYSYVANQKNTRTLISGQCSGYSVSIICVWSSVH